MAALVVGACGPENPWPNEPEPEPECAVDADCAGSPGVCETLTCEGGECALGPADAGVACDDGRFCTTGEVCDGNGACSAGSPTCGELAPGIPRCNEARRECEICTDGRPLIDGECRCPFWNCIARGGAEWCSEEDETEENNVGCFFDGATADVARTP